VPVTYAGSCEPRPKTLSGSRWVTFGGPNNESRTFGLAVEIEAPAALLLGPVVLARR